jgi:F0F1-type ATP synthase assembly protein I
MTHPDELEDKIQKFHNKHNKAPKKSSTKKSPTSLVGYGVLFNFGVELVANILVGVVLGLFIDKYFHTKPMGLLICLMLSIIAAFKIIINRR